MDSILISFIEHCYAVKNFNIVFPIITLILGAWLGNRYAIGRDRKNSFLVVSRPIHESLVTQLRCSDDTIFNSPVTEKDLVRLRSYYAYGTWLNRLRSDGYDRAVQNYKECGKYETTFDEYNYSTHTYPDMNKYRQAIKHLLKYAPIK
jgi:hypothetical protein